MIRVVAGILGLTNLFILWAVLWPFDPLTMHAGSWMTTKQEYRRGEWVTVKLDYCQTMSGTPRLDFTLDQHGIRTALAPRFGNAREECEKVEVPIVQLPSGTPETGPAKILIAITFRLNRLREVSYSFETNTFMIVN